MRAAFLLVSLRVIKFMSRDECAGASTARLAELLELQESSGL
jgi:hypothetical protein